MGKSKTEMNWTEGKMEHLLTEDRLSCSAGRFSDNNRDVLLIMILRPNTSSSDGKICNQLTMPSTDPGISNGHMHAMHYDACCPK